MGNPATLPEPTTVHYEEIGIDLFSVSAHEYLTSVGHFLPEDAPARFDVFTWILAVIAHAIVPFTICLAQLPCRIGSTSMNHEAP